MKSSVCQGLNSKMIWVFTVDRWELSDSKFQVYRTFCVMTDSFSRKIKSRNQCGRPSQFETHMRRLGTQRPSQNVNKSASDTQMCVFCVFCVLCVRAARTYLAKIQNAKKDKKNLLSLFHVTYSPSDLYGTVRLFHYILYNIQSLPFIENGNVISM